jgi:hypothetical protein
VIEEVGMARGGLIGNIQYASLTIRDLTRRKASPWRGLVRRSATIEAKSSGFFSEGVASGS